MGRLYGKGLRGWLVAGLAAACLTIAARAGEPDRAMSQYIRDRWGTERGFPGGPVYAITQTTDGYLWIGTEKGLVRFDGSNFRLMQHANTPALPDGPILGLTADAGGNLWIRLRGPNVLRYGDGKFENVLRDIQPGEVGVTAMCRGKSGEVLLSGLVTGTVSYRQGSVLRLAPRVNLPNFLVISMAETPSGEVWLGTRDTGLFYLREGRMNAVGGGLPDRKINCLLPVGDRELWVGTDNGVVRWDGTRITRSGVPPALSRTQALAMIRDRDANVWVSTSTGLLRLNAAGVASPDQRGHRPGGGVTALFEDREGNIWVGSTQGIERLRDSAFVTYSVAEGMPSEGNGPVYADPEGRTWFAPSDGGLYWLSGGQINRVTAAGLGADVVYSIAGGKGELWVGRQRGGLTRLRYRDGSYRADTFTQAEGLAQNSVYAVHQSRDGSIWAGTLSGGVSQFLDGRFTTYTTANGLASNTVAAILESLDGTMWFATPNGLSALSKGRWQVYTARDGLPSDNVNCLFEDSAGVLWVGTVEGLAAFSSGHVSMPAAAPAPLREQILGLAEDRGGWLWVTTATHLLRVKRDALLGGGLGDAEVREYGLADGLRGVEGVKRHRSVVADPQGQIWFSMNRGLSVVDPSRLTGSSPPALVRIQAVSADGHPLDLQEPLRIPAARQRLAFSYAGLSLAVPERVKYRYMLDGFDHDWSEPVATAEAVYTNLGPGAYRFRVIASNSDGLWNSAEAMIRLEIAPAFWQTWWFRLSGLLAFMLAVLALYRFRLHRLTRRLNVRFEERLAERTRIAQELHDTLLQGFLSASMQLDVAVDHLPTESPARPMLGHVLRLMRQVIDEGRNAVQGLRSTNRSHSFNLEQAFSLIQEELVVREPVGFRVIVEGRPRPLHPVIRDEVYRIGHEALVNAFRHSAARRIEVEVAYLANRLRLLVRDDGRGIDPQVLRSGLDGHWGLSGMRERAERIGARLKVRSRAASGTEVDLSVPGHVAFENSSALRPLRWLARFRRRKAGPETAGAEKRGG
jgi:ligand-binding sensor domain-containing protein/signal transduction histidine kinase